MNRRMFVSHLSSVSAAIAIRSHLSPFDLDGDKCEGRGGQRSRSKPLRVGIIGIVGVGVFFLDEVARRMDYPCKTIAIETSADRLCWSRSQSVLLTSDGAMPATMTEAHRIVRSRKAEIRDLISDLDVAFILTGLNGNAGKGVTLAVAQTLRRAGVFTIAIVPGRREPKASESLQRIVHPVIEVPYPWQAASGAHGPLWREHFGATLARKCRSIRLSLS